MVISILIILISHANVIVIPAKIFFAARSGESSRRAELVASWNADTPGCGRTSCG